MAKTTDKLLVLTFVLFLGGMMFLNILTPDRVFSQRENRYLAKRPGLNVRSIISGRYARKLEEYITDEFALRDHWVLLKADMERLLLKTENNGIFFGRDGYLLEDFRRPGAALAQNIGQIQRFAETFPELPVHVLLAPNSAAVYPDKLPHFASVYDQGLVLEEVKRSLPEDIQLIPVLAALQEQREDYLYFRTDHHWTVRGAYWAYAEVGASLGFTPLGPQDFIREVAGGDFWGTYSSRANRRGLHSDYIEAWQPRNPAAVSISFNDREGIYNSLYFPRHLETRDKYSYFLDGNHPLAVIATDVGNGRKLAVFKDSFAHALLPFLTQHYQEIHVIDLRFFTADLSEYLGKQEIDQALFLYSVSWFASDSSLVNFRSE